MAHWRRLLIASLLIAACAAGRAAPLRIASGFDPQTMDPHALALLYHQRVVYQVYESLVGRDAELQRLRDTVARVRETRRLHAVTVLGDAGLGKSRLLRELRADGSGLRVLALRSQPDGQLRPWGLLRGLLAVQCAVADTDSTEVARRKVEDGLAPWYAERGVRQAHLVGQLAGLDFGDSPHVRGLDPRATVVVGP